MCLGIRVLLVLSPSLCLRRACRLQQRLHQLVQRGSTAPLLRRVGHDLRDLAAAMPELAPFRGLSYTGGSRGA